MSEPEIVIGEGSPHGNLEAIVEQDERVAYFYVRSANGKGFGLKTCWVRNLTKAPKELDLEEMGRGIPPMLPAEHCQYPDGQPPLEPDRLRLVWFPEGDGVALLEDDQMLAAIPPWSGTNGFSGYARDCVGVSQFCWKLEDPKEFAGRIKDAEKFWYSWEAEPTPWISCQESFLARYEEVLGPHDRYFAIDGGYWPPKALARFDREDATYLVTFGISLRPQPALEMYFDDPSKYRRFEFAACFSKGTSEEAVSAFARYLSAQSTLPWEHFSFLAHGHTIPCDAFSNDPHLKTLDFVLLVNRPDGAPDLSVPDVDGDEVNLLWAVPVTAGEQRIAESESSEILLGKMRDGGSFHVIGNRSVVAG